MNSDLPKKLEKVFKHMPPRMDSAELAAFIATVAHGYNLRPDHIWPICFEAWRVLSQLEGSSRNVH